MSPPSQNRRSDVLSAQKMVHKHHFWHAIDAIHLIVPVAPPRRTSPASTDPLCRWECSLLRPQLPCRPLLTYDHLRALLTDPSAKARGETSSRTRCQFRRHKIHRAIPEHTEHFRKHFPSSPGRPTLSIQGKRHGAMGQPFLQPKARFHCHLFSISSDLCLFSFATIF